MENIFEMGGRSWRRQEKGARTRAATGAAFQRGAAAAAPPAAADAGVRCGSTPDTASTTTATCTKCTDATDKKARGCVVRGQAASAAVSKHHGCLD